MRIIFSDGGLNNGENQEIDGKTDISGNSGRKHLSPHFMMELYGGTPENLVRINPVHSACHRPLPPDALTSAPQEENLTAAGLADQYLVHADGIRDYWSEYSVSSGTAENPFSERIRYDYKAPSFARMEQTRSSSRVPGHLRQQTAPGLHGMTRKHGPTTSPPP